MRLMPASSGVAEQRAVAPRPGPLLAVLLNPPSASTGARTLGAVRRAAQALGFDGYEIVNLFAEPTPTVIELNGVTGQESAWPVLQSQLREALRVAGGVLGGWGVAGASGPLRVLRAQRAAWLLEEAKRIGHKEVWMVGGESRHPSRWHQYVADRHGRTDGGTFEERLRQVLVPIPLCTCGVEDRRDDR